MTAPLIGITPSPMPAKDGGTGSICVGEAYIQAVIQAGGIPLVVPVGLNQEGLEKLFSRLDGVLLTGGGDIDPARFDGAAHPRVYGIDARRDDLEIHLTRMAAAARRPFLGICRGIQVINVALGGSLFTDLSDQLPAALKHDQYPEMPRDFLAHSVQIAPGSRLAQILKEETIRVNSMHHQGVKGVATPLTPVAFAPDTLVEAVELPDHPFGLGVQWHPECLQELTPQRELFRALVIAATSA